MRCDGETGQTGNEDNPANVQGDRACKAEWDFIRGPHQGQQSRRLHTKAEDKTAPDLMRRNIEIRLATREPSRQDIGLSNDCP